MKRPQSVQHNKPSFGEFYMQKKLDIIPKFANYRTDGTGRDTYINFNNGGHHQDNISFKYSSKRGLNIFNNGKPYNVISKLAIYRTDGSGRDQYIVKDCGGFFNSTGNSHNFKDTFRQYDKKPTFVSNNDFSHKSKLHILKPVKEKMLEVQKKQRILSARLSVPKKVNTKYVNCFD